MSAITVSNNRFAFDLYDELKKQSGNLFFSPFSISIIGAIVYEGACGETARQIQQTFRFGENFATRTGQEYKDIQERLNSPRNPYTLHTANALWVDYRYKLCDGYEKIVRDYYAGEVGNMEFRFDAENCKKRINEWVARHTEQRITGIFDGLDPLTKMVLVNAIYFKGNWEVPFDKTRTRVEYFHLKDENIRVPMMKMGKELYFRYGEDETVKAIEIPYRGDELSMLVLLPKKELSEVENSMSIVRLEELQSSMYSAEVNVWMPKFEFRSRYDLREPLENLGMKIPFEGRADFSGISRSEGLFIGQMAHDAYVKADEEGTEAAAATGVIGKLGIPPRRIFKANRPFMFTINYETTGTILFMGRVMNPIQ